MTAILLGLAALTLVDPITPSQLEEALMIPPRGEAATRLAERIRAAFPPGTDLKSGRQKPLVERSYVAFVVEAPVQGPAPRVGGMLNHSRGYDLVPVGETGLWVRVETIPTDTKFAYTYELAGKTLGRGTVEMPGWKYPPESTQLPGKKYGTYEPLKFRSTIFGNNRTGWIYVPAAHDPKTPCALMVFQDGDAYKGEHVGTVVDNLIAAGAMPVTILLLLNPGTNDDGRSNRSVEYDTVSPRYVEFLEKEAIPQVTAKYALRTDPMSRGIGGASSGGICAFNASWHRPDLFGRVCSQIGSFTNIRGGHVYPELVRKTPKKPIRVLLHDGTNDLINRFGDWWQANEAMFAALQAQGYDVTFIRDRGFHAYWSCGVRLPEALRATWGTGRQASQ
ncbi:MAG: alpha/beta hydrolase-fold protein [Isosphaeraceae bacterium]